MLQVKTWLSSICLAVCLISCAATARGAVDYDPFAYSGTALDGQSGGTGWNAGWFTTGTSQPNTLSDDSTSLIYPVPFESPLITPATSGGRVRTENPAANANTSRLLSSAIPLNVDGSTKYVSALFRKTRGNGEVSTDNVLLEFVDASGNRRWGLGIAGSQDLPWLNANGVTSPATQVTAGDTYFMVAKIVSGIETDTAYLKVFGTGYGTQVPFMEPTEWDATLTETTNAVLDRIRIRIDPGNSLGTPGEVDELRVADNWLEAIGQPATPMNIPGDYDGNEVVDAADYVIWRQNQGGPGGSASVGDSEPDNDVDAADYDFWRARFGNTSGSGAGTGSAVPEPASLIWITIASAAIWAGGRRRP
jgi:hypothetical protein